MSKNQIVEKYLQHDNIKFKNVKIYLWVHKSLPTGQWHVYILEEAREGTKSYKVVLTMLEISC